MKISSVISLIATPFCCDHLTSLPEGTRIKAKEVWFMDLQSIAKGVRLEVQKVYWKSEDRWHTPKVFRRLVAAAAKKGKRP